MTTTAKPSGNTAATGQGQAGQPDADALLRWYDQHRRDLPWRAGSGETPDPYQVWLSEIMLQQTTVETVKSYFREFLRRWPTVQALAEAELDEVLHCWQGLGYYARARNLHKCARTVAAELGGRFPSDESDLLDLPGVGAYTAAAIGAIAFGKPTVPVDGNIERVFARLYAIDESGPRLKAAVKSRAGQLILDRPGDFWQAVMDLGATICRPKSPNCLLCPWSQNCAARSDGKPDHYPIKKPKKEKPTRYGVAFLTLNPSGSILLRRRPQSGLLGGMIEVPSTEWREKPWREDEISPFAPMNTEWQQADGSVHHTFTHFHLVMKLLVGQSTGEAALGAFWCPPRSLADQALPTVMKKLLKHANILPR
ncbi:MAG: A/G-specific adenine glycosylase [Rhodospirillales bacterium]|nr:A/G-specific adenine glycosylase [Rhodospirillales bacterium]